MFHIVRYSICVLLWTAACYHADQTISSPTLVGSPISEHLPLLPSGIVVERSHKGLRCWLSKIWSFQQLERVVIYHYWYKWHRIMLTKIFCHSVTFYDQPQSINYTFLLFKLLYSLIKASRTATASSRVSHVEQKTFYNFWRFALDNDFFWDKCFSLRLRIVFCCLRYSQKQSRYGDFVFDYLNHFY